VIRVNRATIPVGSSLLEGGTSFAGDAVSRFIRMTEGSITRADFYLAPPRQARLLSTIIETPGLAREDLTITALFIISLKDTTTRGVMLVDTLPAGCYYDMKSIEINGEAIGTEGKKSRFLSLQLQDLLRRRADGDTIQISIVYDSTRPNRLVHSQGKLILSYPAGRDAVFKARQISDESDAQSDLLIFPDRPGGIGSPEFEPREGEFEAEIPVSGRIGWLQGGEA
jgi:hypothetical protein